jgi:hypothetical protein
MEYYDDSDNHQTALVSIRLLWCPGFMKFVKIAIEALSQSFSLWVLVTSQHAPREMFCFCPFSLLSEMKIQSSFMNLWIKSSLYINEIGLGESTSGGLFTIVQLQFSSSLSADTMYLFHTEECIFRENIPTKFFCVMIILNFIKAVFFKIPCGIIIIVNYCEILMQEMKKIFPLKYSQNTFIR